jgi:hypothetical protein
LADPHLSPHSPIANSVPLKQRFAHAVEAITLGFPQSKRRPSAMPDPEEIVLMTDNPQLPPDLLPLLLSL